MKATEFFTFPKIRRRLYAGPLGPYIDQFAKQLHKKGYARETIRFKLRAVANFSYWLEQRELSSEAADADQIKRFLAYRKRIGRRVSDEAAALQEMTMLVYDQNPTGLSQPSEVLTDRALAEQDFRHYLSRARGLSA